jgi:hypothetical protein
MGSLRFPECPRLNVVGSLIYSPSNHEIAIHRYFCCGLPHPVRQRSAWVGRARFQPNGEQQLIR